MSSSVLQSVTSQTKAVQELAAGGSDPEVFDWQEVWYPVSYVKDLDKSQPTRFTLLEQDIVLRCKD